VYLGLVPGAAASPTDVRHFAGVLSLFGVFEATANGGVGGGSGRTRLLDVGTVVAGLPSFNPLQASVTLMPEHPDRELDDVGLTAERISLELG
jgi:hypothetical protein